MRPIKTVTDQNGVRYELTALLGRGGQGAVYAIKGGRLAVKILTDGNQARRERLRNQLTHVRRLPLRDLALAKPLEMLRPPHTGYVMELLTDMVPIKTLMVPKKGEAPSIEWYIEGGGLRKRLLVLGRAAHLISQLHGKGLVFSDPSPANIFISKARDNQEVWMIDTDNLQYESSPCAAFFTPGYGAPELLSNASGVTTLTDAFSFAVIAFQALSLAHPFIGDMVNDGDPELEDQAFAGKLPWIDDPEDDSNRATFGVPRQWVLSPRLMDAFYLAFGPGRSDPTVRPGASEWADRLYGAADATIECPACSGSFYFTQPHCPWCERARPSFVTAVFHLWDPEFGPQGGILAKPKGETMRPVLAGHGAVSAGRAFVITRRLAFGQLSGPSGEPVVSVTLSGQGITLKSLDGNVYPLFSPTGSQKTEIGDREKTIRLEERQGSWRLHFGPNDALHRVMSFELRKGMNA
jgi:DNA-binding helix-hairpin-helix protein with protein kinase domain